MKNLEKTLKVIVALYIVGVLVIPFLNTENPADLLGYWTILLMVCFTLIPFIFLIYRVYRDKDNCHEEVIIRDKNNKLRLATCCYKARHQGAHGVTDFSQFD